LSRNLPNFIIAGVARCGTTSLYHYMKQHPEIGFPAKKEPKYFSAIKLDFPHRGPGDDTVDQGMIRSEDEYLKLFAKADNFKVFGEASSDYLYYHEKTIPGIKQMLGDIPIILVLRNPVERAYSAYNNLVRDGRETLAFMDALNAEEERLADNWDWMWAYKAGSLYSDGVRDFMDNFSRVKVILFDDLAGETDDVLREVFEFLGVNTDTTVDSDTVYSHSGKPKNSLVAKLTDRNNKFMFALRQMIMAIVPRSLLEKAASRMLKKESLPGEARSHLQDTFREDIRKLEALLGKDLGHWR
jgi:hypothetical protein